MGSAFSSTEPEEEKKKLFETVIDSHQARALRAQASLGVVRLDYKYPPCKGDIDSPDSFEYPVYYKVVPGLTFEMCQSGKLTPEVEKRFIGAIEWLDRGKNVSAITGDCGFMMWIQDLARQYTHKPVLMSSLVQLPAIVTAYSHREEIAIFTANSVTLKPMYELIQEECGVSCDDKRFHIVGCQDVPGFEAVAVAGQLNIAKVTPGIVELAKQVLVDHPNVRAFLFECTQLPPFSDDVRHATKLPVYDAITCCNMFIEGVTDNPRFGKNDWQTKFDGLQEAYKFGDNLTKEEHELLISCLPVARVVALTENNSTTSAANTTSEDTTADAPVVETNKTEAAAENGGANEETTPATTSLEENDSGGGWEDIQPEATTNKQAAEVGTE